MPFQPALDLLLKVTPPRVPRQWLAREQMLIGAGRLRDFQTLLVQAPAGYGKTALLAQWRLELLGSGVVVAWITGQAEDDEQRLLQSLTLAVRVGTGRPGFGQQLPDSWDATPLEGITRWLAELVQAASNVVLIVDELDRMPARAQALLAYLIRNQPPNLRVIVGARGDCDLSLDDLVSYGRALRLGPADLRLSLEQTLVLIRDRMGINFDADTAARLHEFCEGWPLGLQLLLTALSQGAEPRDALQSLEGLSLQEGGGLHQQLMALLFSQLSEADMRLLESIAIADHLHPALCRAISGTADTEVQLARLLRDTPLLTGSEQGEWLRMHTFARDCLRQRLLRQRTPAELADLHRRAAGWLRAKGMLEAAAHHAWEAGEHEEALDLAERSLYEALTQRGQQSMVRDWLRRLPEHELQRRPRLQLAAAWALAVSESGEAAESIVAAVLSRPDISPALRCECALIRSGAAIFADEPDRFAALHDLWAQAPPLQDPLLLQVHANRSAFRLVLQGEPALARLRLHQPAQLPVPAAMRYITHWSDLIRGLSYLWEGQVRQAEALLQPALHRAESEQGRRSAFACMLAALLAAGIWEQGRTAEAQALLANRIDVLERSGMPEAVLLGYRTLARIAAAEGAEYRALDLLAALDAVGQLRRLPRLRIISLTEQLRLHARSYRDQTCAALLAKLDEMMASDELPQGPLWRRDVEMQAHLARGQAAIAARNWRGALGHLKTAQTSAQALRRVRGQIEAQGLRALAMERCGERSASALLRETRSLADALGLQRVFSDAHPDLSELLDPAWPPNPSLSATPLSPRTFPETSAPARAHTGTGLTPKEREVLELLARNLTNKEAALALQVGEETVKWHVKNLFAKLDAGTRKQLVGRARILGLLPSAA